MNDEVMTPVPLDWRFSQVFGERAAGEEIQDGNFIFFITFFFNV